MILKYYSTHTPVSFRFWAVRTRKKGGGAFHIFVLLFCWFVDVSHPQVEVPGVWQRTKSSPARWGLPYEAFVGLETLPALSHVESPCLIAIFLDIRGNQLKCGTPYTVQGDWVQARFILNGETEVHIYITTIILDIVHRHVCCLSTPLRRLDPCPHVVTLRLALISRAISYGRRQYPVSET